MHGCLLTNEAMKMHYIIRENLFIYIFIAPEATSTCDEIENFDIIQYIHTSINIY